MPGARGVRKAAAKGARGCRASRAVGRGRGKNKAYDDPIVQAKFERQKELLENIARVKAALIPVNNLIADKTLNLLVEKPELHKEVPEGKAIQAELDWRLERRIKHVEEELERKMAQAKIQFELQMSYSTQQFVDGYEAAADDHHAACLNRLTILADLHREGVDADVTDTRYQYTAVTNEEADSQGPHVGQALGVEGACPSRLAPKRLVSKTQCRGARPAARTPAVKRKAEQEPDAQPSPKKQAASLPTTAGPSEAWAPHHIGGLLSAQAEAAVEAESNAASPTPVEDGPSLDLSPDDGRRGKAAAKKGSAVDVPALPGGASEADERGVRTGHRRGAKANNRLIIPRLFEFGDSEIGYRDSTNDSSRKATKGNRGRLLTTANSGHWYLDQTINNYNCLTYDEDDLEPGLVKKHNLHPRYGFFLPDSNNEAEAAKPLVTGGRPVVLVAPDGRTSHTSRSVRDKRMDAALARQARQDRMASTLAAFATSESIDRHDISAGPVGDPPEPEWLPPTDPAQERTEGATSDTVPACASSDAETQKPLEKPFEEHATMTLLRAAASVDEEARRRQAMTNAQRPSRPAYDAVRDLFGSSQAALVSTPEPPAINTQALSVLADVAEETSHQQAQAPAKRPRLRGASAPQQPVSFLQTALNAAPSFAHMAPTTPSRALSLSLSEAGYDHLASLPAIPSYLRPQQGADRSLPPLRVPKRDHTGVAKNDTAAVEGMSVPQQGAPKLFPPGPHYLKCSPPFHYLDRANPGNVVALEPQAVMESVTSLWSAKQASASSSHLVQGCTLPALTLDWDGQPSTSHPQLVPIPTPQSTPVAIAPMPTQRPPPFVMAGSPNSLGMRQGADFASGPNAAKYRRIAAAPTASNRPWLPHAGSELRLSSYDPKGSIKDYCATAPPPSSGPTTIRGWNVNNVSKGRNKKKDDPADDKDSAR